MKKLMMVLIFVGYSGMMQGTWLLAKLINQSDITFIKAYRDQDIEMPSVTQLITQAVGGAQVAIPGELLFGSLGGCKIVGVDPAGNQLSFVLLGDPAHKVANGRANMTDLDSRNAAAQMNSGMMARIFVVRADGNLQLAASLGYAGKNQPMQLNITGSNGQYQVSMQQLS